MRIALLSFENFSLFLRWPGESYFPPHDGPHAETCGGWAYHRTIYRGKFSESSIGVPIVAVAGSDGQSALPLVGQVGASRDLSEATRCGAVRALWGTVTHAVAGPISFSGGIIHHVVDLVVLESRTVSLTTVLPPWTGPPRPAPPLPDYHQPHTNPLSRTSLPYFTIGPLGFRSLEISSDESFIRKPIIFQRGHVRATFQTHSVRRRAKYRKCNNTCNDTVVPVVLESK